MKIYPWSPTSLPHLKTHGTHRISFFLGQSSRTSPIFASKPQAISFIWSSFQSRPLLLNSSVVSEIIHVVGHNQGLCHRLIVSLRWTVKLAHHTRLLFITALHGDSACASYMLARSSEVHTAAPGAGCVCSHRFPFPHQEPHEIVFGHHPALLASIGDREVTLSARTPNNLLSTNHISPPAYCGILYLAELLTDDYRTFVLQRTRKAEDVISGNVPNTLFTLSVVSSEPTSLPYTCHSFSRSQPEFHASLMFFPYAALVSGAFLYF